MTTITTSKIESAVNVIFEVLGEPTDGWQRIAFAQYQKGDAIAVKKINAQHLRDYYCKCLAFLAALSDTPNPQKVLAAAANAAADQAQVRALERISDGNAIAFESEDPLENAIKNIRSFLTPSTEYHQLALSLGTDYSALQELKGKNLDDDLIKALVYLSKATPLSTAYFTILAEAGMAAAQYVRSVEHQKITAAIADLFPITK